MNANRTAKLLKSAQHAKREPSGHAPTLIAYLLGRQTMRILRIGLLLGLTLALANCSDDTQPVPPDSGPDMMDYDMGDPDAPVGEGITPCNLAINTINGRPVLTVDKLTAADDQDLKTPGIQIDVEVTGSGLADGTEVFLNVTQLSPDPSVKAAANKATFTDVTIDSVVTNLVIKTYDKDNKCGGDTFQTTVEPPPECYFIYPQTNTTLTVTQANIKIGTFNAAGGSVILRVNSSIQGQPQTPDAKGEVTFKAVTLPKSNSLELQGEVTVDKVTRICKVTIKVKTDAPSCVIKSFSPVDVTINKISPDKGLGLAQDASTATAGLQTTITVETDGDLVDLFHGGTNVIGSEIATVGSASFSNKTLPDGNLSLTAKCSDSATKKTSNSPEYKVWVDTAEPEAVTDFSCKVSNNRAGVVTCTWTAIKDPGGAKASGMELYKLGYVKGALVTTSNWNTATTVDVVPIAAGNTHSVDIKDLPLATKFGFGVMPIDYTHNTVATGPFVSTLLDVDFHVSERLGSAITGAKNWGQNMAAGDFDCDGNTDIAVGNPNSLSGKGKVYIYQGTANGLTSAPWKIFNGTVAGGNFGARVAALNNFDKDTDNCNDLAVLSSHGGSSNKAQVFVYLGRKSNFFDRDDVTTGLGAELIYELGTSATTTELLGANLAGGDFDGDGATDLFISYGDTAAATDTSHMLVVYGDSTLTLMASGTAPKKVVLPGGAGVQVTGGKHTEAFGASLSNAGDLDGDTTHDFVVGAPSTGTSGAVYVVKGGARATTLPEEITLANTRVIKIAGGSSNATFGTTVAFVGDMDNDQTNEFAVGDPGFSSSLGTVYIFNLKGTTPPSSVTDAIATVTNDLTGAASDKFGTVLAGSGVFAPGAGADLDKDSYADLVVSSETAGSTALGAVFQIGGATALTGLATSKATFTFSPTGTSSFGATVILAEDIDADGYIDVIVGDPGFSSGVGRFFAYH
jgi:FG-GAP repeat